MKFGEVIEGLKEGRTFYRASWEDASSFIYLVKGSIFEVNRAPLSDLLHVGTKVEYENHIDLMSYDIVDDAWAAGVWDGPSVDDILAEDWEEEGPWLSYPSDTANDVWRYHPCGNPA